VKFHKSAFTPFVALFIVFAFATPEAGPRWIWTTEWSPDSKYIAVGGDDSMLWLYNAKTYKLENTFKAKGMVKGMNWHPSSQEIAIATSHGAELLNLQKKELVSIPHIKTGGRAIAWNKSGELLALADGSGVVQLMDRQGNFIRSINKANRHSYLALDWHPQNIIAAASDELNLFDTSGKQLQMIQHRKEPTGILTVDWHPSGDFIAVGDYGHEDEGVPTLLQFFDESGKNLKVIKGSKKEYRTIKWNPSGDLIATASDALRIWSKDGKLLYTGKSNENLWGLSWSPDGKFIATGAFGDGSVTVWNNKAQVISLLSSPSK